MNLSRKLSSKWGALPLLLFIPVGLAACNSPHPAKLKGDETYAVLHQPPYARGGGGLYFHRAGLCTINGKDPSGEFLKYNHRVSPGEVSLKFCNPIADPETFVRQGIGQCDVTFQAIAGQLYILDFEPEDFRQTCVYNSDMRPVTCCRVEIPGEEEEVAKPAP
ncbi:MAG: hypothetical protein AAFR74_00450 [Pseudomonadota bacterium]